MKIPHATPKRRFSSGDLNAWPCRHSCCSSTRCAYIRPAQRMPPAIGRTACCVATTTQLIKINSQANANFKANRSGTFLKRSRGSCRRVSGPDTGASFTSMSPSMSPARISARSRCSACVVITFSRDEPAPSFSQLRLDTSMFSRRNKRPAQ